MSSSQTLSAACIFRTDVSLEGSDSKRNEQAGIMMLFDVALRRPLGIDRRRKDRLEAAASLPLSRKVSALAVSSGGCSMAA